MFNGQSHLHLADAGPFDFLLFWPRTEWPFPDGMASLRLCLAPNELFLLRSYIIDCQWHSSSLIIVLPSVDGRIRPRNSFKSDPDLLSPVIDTCCVFVEIVTDWMAV